MEVIQVREYAKLIKAVRSSNGTLDEAHISHATFDFLADLIEQKRLDGSVFLNYIKLGSQVGYLETPDIGLEILPKTALHTQDNEKDQLRELLQKMVSVVVQVKSKEMYSAHLVRNNLPLHEWIYEQFLNELKILFKEGLKRDYECIARTEKFMRGRLDINQVMRQKVGQAHLFPIRYDEFNFNRLENRLIKTALSYLFKKTKNADNWRVANELMQRLSDLEAVQNAHVQLKYWQDGKLMKSYRAILPWCTLILEKMNPNFQKGQHHGIALLFPMEKLFEAYVGHYLKENSDQYHVHTQEQKHHLVKHQDKNLFQLKPDFVLRHKITKHVIIADTKWKILDQYSGDGSEKYGISQTDLYQMLAYGYKYQQNDENCTEMILIYPYHDKFTERLSIFEFHSENLKLHIVPFKLWDANPENIGLKLAEVICNYELKYSSNYS